MTTPNWTATVAGNNIPNIQDVTIRQGQNKITDLFQSASLSMSGRRPDLLPALKLGDVLTVTLSFQSLTRTFTFRVADLQVQYGYTQEYDSWTIVGEDAFAVLGRAAVTRSWVSGSLAETNAKNLVEAVGLTFSIGTSLTSTATCNAQTITNGNALDILNTLANTEGARLSAGATAIQWLPRNWQTVVPTVHASDDGTGTQPIQYDQLAFTSLADNLADYAVVNIRGGNTVASGTGIYSISLDSYSVSDQDGQYVAEYEIGQLEGVETPVPSKISYLLNRQTTIGWVEWDNYKKAVVKFRGTTYNAFVIGVTYSGTIGQTRVTWDLASSEFYRFLTLDDPILGRLDQNKLGW